MPYKGNMTWEVVETLADVQVNDTNRLVVDVNRSSTGLVSVGVREFWTPDGGDNWYPGKKGLALKPALWAELLPAMQAWLDQMDPDDASEDNSNSSVGNGRKLGNGPAPKKSPNAPSNGNGAKPRRRTVKSTVS